MYFLIRNYYYRLRKTLVIISQHISFFIDTRLKIIKMLVKIRSEGAKKIFKRSLTFLDSKFSLRLKMTMLKPRGE